MKKTSSTFRYGFLTLTKINRVNIEGSMLFVRAVLKAFRLKNSRRLE
jgi:hypothetical protein